MTLLAKIRGEGPRGASAAVDNPNRSDQLLAPLLSVCRQPAINNMFLTVRRFPAVPSGNGFPAPLSLDRALFDDGDSTELGLALQKESHP